MLNKKKIKADLCVVGGGMSGICAAIAAAREGISVVLMHERPVLGGNASSEIRMWISGSRGKNNMETGILEEIMLENMRRNPTKNYYLWDSVLYDFVLREKNITLLLNCACMDADITNGDFADGRKVKINSVTGYQLTTQTMIEVEAKYFSDCSGDSILAPLTGAEFRIGREAKTEFNEDTYVEKADDFTMGMSCLIQGRETTRDVKFTAPSWSTKLTDEQVENRKPNIYDPTENYWYLELGGNRDTIHETEEITKDLVPLAIGMWDYIKNSGKYDADKWELEFLGYLPGKRESRRMCGEYIITQRDISDGVVFEDVIAYGGWPLDDHFPMGFYHVGTANTDIQTPAPYTIPYRALYSKNVENLFFAGRNISMTHTAMSSIRVMATCALLGQAVGVAAAIATKNSLTPNGVYKEKLSELQNILLNADCFLPSKLREISESCKKAAPYKELCDGFDRPHAIYNKETCGIKVKNGTEIKYTLENENVSDIHIVFDSDLERATLSGHWCERQRSTRCNVLLNSPDLIVPKTLCKDFTLLITDENGNTETLKYTENLKRAYDIPVNMKVKEITLIPETNWGDSDTTAIFSFDFRN